VQASETEAIRRDLTAIVGARQVSDLPSIRGLYSRDCWPRTLLWERDGELRYQPDVVVWPASTDDVAAIVRYARQRHIPLTPFGAGSSVVAGAIPLRAGITVDLKRMRRLLSVDLEERSASAQAGIMGQRLEDALEQRGATMGHFPSSIYCSTLGGWIAARGAGQFSSHYGKIEDMVLGLTAVAGTGEVLRAGPERVPGPDLIQLLTGSEGTLAIVTEATFTIHPRPTARALRGYRLKSVAAGIEVMRLIFRAGLRPHLLRLYDPLDSRMVGDHEAKGSSESVPSPLKAAFASIRSRSLGYALSAPRVLNGAIDMLPPRCLLVVSYEGESQAQAEVDLQATSNLVRDAGGTEAGEGPAKRWYRRRHAASYRQSGIFAARAWVDTMEVCATWDKVEAVYNGVRRALRSDAFVMCHFSHAYLEGSALYFTFVGPALSVKAGEEHYERTWRTAMEAALEAGATLSHHHGVGSAKARYLPDELGDAGMRLLRSLKAAFDPDAILNPGKLAM
jgi:alkyldihydroxyacetonephosphate synthase